MGLKKGKYVYVELGKDKYVKVRVLKSRAVDNPQRYIPLNIAVKKPPKNATIVKASEIPTEVISKLL
jgi:hypothetical protein